MNKEQPEALQLPTLPFAVFDEFGQPCEDRVRDHFAAAFEALRTQIGQGEPEEGDLLTIAYLHGFAKGKETASTHPAPQSKQPTIDERSMFEEWFVSKYHDRLDRNMPDKSYNDPKAYVSWEAWKASRGIKVE